MAPEVLPNGSLIDDGDNSLPVSGRLTGSQLDSFNREVAFAKLVGRIRANLDKVDEPERMNDPEKIIPVGEVEHTEIVAQKIMSAILQI